MEVLLLLFLWPLELACRLLEHIFTFVVRKIAHWLWGYDYYSYWD